ncbi:MAG: EamA family transporter, partial [Syntrophothermus sp.]
MKNKIKKLKNSLKFFSEGALLFSTLIWGGTFVIIKDSLNDVSTMLFVGIRFLAAALLLLPFVYKQLKGMDRKLLLKAMLLGTFLFLGFAPQTVGLKCTSA